MEGIINILKPPGMTSHDVIAFLRRTLGEKKIGHCGTLDPEAAGVLPVCVGQATKLAEYLSGGEKAYYCEMAAGYETDTQDIWGETTWVYPGDVDNALLAPDRIAEAARSLVGEIEQEVPAYSAIKREGKSLHQYAREGKLYTGITRTVSVRSIQLLDIYAHPDADAEAHTDTDADTDAHTDTDVDTNAQALAQARKIAFIVECGAGTYVRMICRDIGRKLGCGGVMSFLLRLRVGPFRLEDSFTLEEIRQWAGEGKAGEGFIAPKELALAYLPKLTANSHEAARLRQGQAMWLPADGLALKSGGTAPSGESLMPPGSGAASGDGLVQGSTAAAPPKGGYRAWVADGEGRLAALGICKPGGDSRSGHVYFKPDKTFS